MICTCPVVSGGWVAHRIACPQADAATLRKALEAAEAKLAKAERDNAGLEERIAALEERDKWPPCACSYDAPGDVCAVHSPRVAAAESREKATREALGEVLADYEAAIKRLADMGEIPRALNYKNRERWTALAAGKEPPR